MKTLTVSRIREFNRFYWPAFDLLGNSYLGSAHLATEAQVLFEIFTHDGCTAASIAKTMHIDKSYLSRIIRSHEKKGDLYRTVSPADSRAYALHLTAKGFRILSASPTSRSNGQIQEKFKFQPQMTANG